MSKRKVCVLKNTFEDLVCSTSFVVTDSTNDSSIELLKKIFALSDLIISPHMNKLLLIESLKTICRVKTLRKMYDTIEIQVRSLQSLGVSGATYSKLLCSIILQKIHNEINLQHNRQSQSEDQFDIRDLKRKGFSEE